MNIENYEIAKNDEGHALVSFYIYMPDHDGFLVFIAGPNKNGGCDIWGGYKGNLVEDLDQLPVDLGYGNDECNLIDDFITCQTSLVL